MLRSDVLAWQVDFYNFQKDGYASMMWGAKIKRYNNTLKKWFNRQISNKFKFVMVI